MRLTDRLFELVQIMRDGRLRTAADLAERVGVSVRTLYRDIDTLTASGVPIEGERGRSYICRDRVTLPPLNVTADELDALRLAVSLVARTGDAELGAAARSLAGKVKAVLPARLGAAVSRPAPAMATACRIGRCPGRSASPPFGWRSANGARFV